MDEVALPLIGNVALSTVTRSGALAAVLLAITAWKCKLFQRRVLSPLVVVIMAVAYWLESAPAAGDDEDGMMGSTLRDSFKALYSVSQTTLITFTRTAGVLVSQLALCLGRRADTHAYGVLPHPHRYCLL